MKQEHKLLITKIDAARPKQFFLDCFVASAPRNDNRLGIVIARSASDEAIQL